MHPFLTDVAKARCEEVVREIESTTSAEVVVTVGTRSDLRTRAQLLSGLLFGFSTLLFLLFHPHEFLLTRIPMQVAIGGAIGALLARFASPWARLFATRAEIRGAARLAASAAFSDQGIFSTLGRTGILIHVSLWEQCVELRFDRGIHDALRLELGMKLPDLESALRKGSIEAFVETMKTWAAPLSRAFPKGEDDVNELPDGIL